MTAGRRRSLAALGSVIALGCGGLGVAGGLIGAPRPAAPTLATAEPLVSAPVTTRSFDDRRIVEVSLVRGAEPILSTPVGGVVTRSHCLMGGQLVSGDPVLSVDGQPIVGLATSVPLWRDLERGDRGDDVSALQAELTRLGHRTPVDGRVGPSTLAAVGALLRQPGTRPTPLEAISRASFVWLPSATASVTSCRVSVGATVQSGDAVATTPAALVDAGLSRLPNAPVDGARSLTVGAVTVPLDTDGHVRDPESLAALATTDEVIVAITSDTTDSGTGTSVTGSYALTTPLDVSVVPPPALVTDTEGRTCVVRDGGPVPVRLIGSELGQSFVIPDDASRLDRVDVGSVVEHASCR
ncbi:peptidoglycan-binding domain-containing protein [Frigoribacterium sp. 2-23]|uniref:peptidoglycan-binding domain-containing protein n=1 Tax=Frigoribacterium sp. 2-23 TaxID=3415006 RepID=UPI003C6F9341